MSIIERVAELLGPIEQGRTKGTDSQLTASGEPTAIERVVRDRSERFGRGVEDSATIEPWLEPDGLDAEPETKSEQYTAARVPATFRSSRAAASHRARETSATLRVDRDHLRRYGMVDPGGARTPVAECFRLIKSQILMNLTKAKSTGSPANLVMVTSALPSEGKTFCAVNLAISIALERDRTVLLVDGDVAKPSVPRALGLVAERGLMDCLLDPRIELESLLFKTDIGKLSLLPAGTGHQHATELLASDGMAKLAREMAERYDDRIVIFDSPPVLGASEAGVLARHMGQIVMVVEAGKTPKAILEEALERIDTSKFAGLVLNKGQGPRRGYGYGGYGSV